MNLPPTNLPAPNHARADADDINLLNLVDIVLDNRWLIAAATAVALVIGGLYAFLSTPIYEANTLIQVESSKGGSGLGEAGDLFNIQSSAGAEMEILRSRLVLGQVAKNLQLDLSVSPKYAPFYGRWLARRATQPSEPGFLGMSGYVSGAEALTVTEFEVSPELEGQQFSVILNAQGYALQSDAGQVIAQGQFGQALRVEVQGQKINMLVTGAIGKPGAEFYLTRASRLAVTQSLQGALTITELGRQSGVIQASLEGTDPVRVARVLNEVGALYTLQNVERKSAEAEKTLAFLDTQLPLLRKQLEESENKFNRFRNQNGVFELGAEAQAVLDQAVKYQTTLVDLQQKRRELDARFTVEHPSVKTIDAQIKALMVELATLVGKSKTLPNLEQDLLRLTRDVKVSTELYTGLLNNYQQLRLVKEGKVGNVRVVDVAAVPEQPIKPRRSMVLAIAALLGLAAGLALALARNSLRPGIRDPADIEQHSDLHVFATVPHSLAQEAQARNIKAKAPGTHLLALTAPQDPAIESLRSLRTALQFAMLDAPNNIVLLTGPTPGIGKSFISANFAAVLGAANKRVLLVDADLRKGHIHKFFGLQRGHGLSELVAGSRTLAQVVRQNVAPMVDLISTGTLPPNPAELLMSPACAQLLHSLAGQYDIVLIDTPPVLAVSDTQVLAPQVGTVFLVARAEVSTLGELQEAAKRLMQSGVAVRGVIFNDLNTSKRRYGYGGGYGYKYSRYRYTSYKY